MAERVKQHVDCLCDHAYESLGHFLGVDCGKGWVRVTSHPGCPHHGETAANYPFKRSKR